jgi:hypothetical protein
VFSSLPALVSAQEVQAENAALATRVAPGESLPLEIHLSNFGSNSRVDVTLLYQILDPSGSVMVSQTETVAVQTSASYIERVALPNSIPQGLYTARTTITYDGQQVPATATQQFSVEQKIFGIFVSDFWTYLAILCIAILLAVLLILFFLRYRKQTRFAPIDYSHIPRKGRVYYEIISDAIQQMRYHEGDRAIAVIIADIPGLVIDADSGRVMALTRDPSEIIAAIVSQYEHAFGKHINLSFVGAGESRAIVR